MASALLNGVGLSIAKRAEARNGESGGERLARGKPRRMGGRAGGTGSFGIGIVQNPLRAQTFTAGRTGKIDRIGVMLTANTSPPLPTGTIFADIYSTDPNNAPLAAAAPLGSGKVASTKIPSGFGQTTFIRLSHPAKVVIGTRYAIVVHSDQAVLGVYSWDGSSGPGPDQYPNGDEATRSDPNGAWTLFPGQDFSFQTFVAVRRRHHH